MIVSTSSAGGRADDARLRFSRRGLNYHADLFVKAKADYDRLKKGDLHRWLEEARRNPEMRDDPFTIAVSERYQRDYDTEMTGIQQRLLDAILHACRAARLRFVSLERGNLIGFEGVEVPRYGSSVFKAPAAWVIAEKLETYVGCGNSGQAQVDLSMLAMNQFGVYDLRSKPFTLIGAPISYETMRLSIIGKPFDTENMAAHLRRCGSF